MRVLAIIVTYYPLKELLVKNVNALYDWVDKILIWENTPQLERLNFRFISAGKIDYCGDDTNSISHGLNYAWMYAKSNGFDFLLTLDQDSIFKDIDKYVITTINKNKEGYCLMGPSIVCKNDATSLDEIKEINLQSHLITSGMLLPISILDELGGYNEDFKIEAVDVDLCFRARKAGFKIFQNNNGILVQRFGAPYEKTLLGKKYIGPNYSDKRLHEIFRNHIILYRRYRDKTLKRYVLAYFRNYVPRIILWEDHKLRKLISILKGIKEGLLYDLSKYEK